MSEVEARRYLDKSQALVAQSLLAAQGILARVAADDEGGMAPHMSYVTGVRLLVQEDDFTRATQALAEAEQSSADGEDTIGDAWRTTPGGDERPGPERKLLLASTRDPGVLAYRAAILGIVLIPVVLHLYSLWQVGRAARTWATLSERSRRQTIIAGAIDAIVLIVFMVALPHFF